MKFHLPWKREQEKKEYTLIYDGNGRADRTVNVLSAVHFGFRTGASGKKKSLFQILMVGI